MIRNLLAVLALLLAPVVTLSSAAAQGVVSSADPRATAAGQQILRDGGSATDAAIAMMLALTVVEPQSSGIGGGGFLIHHDAETAKLSTIDGREKAPASAKPTRFLNADGSEMDFRIAWPGGLSVGVPGNIRLAADAHAKWGKLPWAKLFAPAITLADQGYQVNATLAGFLNSAPDQWADFPAARALYFVDGKPAPAGTTVRNPALARLLRDVAAKGPNAFYTGANARAIVDAVAGSKRNPAMLTLADLAAYRATERPGVCRGYRQYRLCGMGPPSSGATTVFQILALLEPYDLKAMGPDNPMTWHLLGQAMQLAYADRDTWLGDADFVKVPVEGLLSPTYVARRRELISPFSAAPTYVAGNPPGSAAQQASAPVLTEAGTTHFVAVDGAGDVANWTSTVESLFGSQLVANGFILNNELTDFNFAPTENGKPVANAVAAGKRPLSSMSPTIAYGADGKPLLAVGSAGGRRIIMHVTKTLIGVLDFELSAADAIALPNLYFGNGALMVENNPRGQAIAAELERFGQPVRAVPLGSKLNAAHRTATGWTGAADPRGPGNTLQE